MVILKSIINGCRLCHCISLYHENKTDNYLQYLICGVIPWNFFTTVMGLGMGSIKNNAGVIKKVYFLEKFYQYQPH